MDLKAAKPLIKNFLKHGRNIGLVGQPGVGKTETIREIVSGLTAADICTGELDKATDGGVEELERLKKVPVRFIPIATTTKESVDVAGLPTVENGRTTWCPPHWIPTGDEPAVVFLDEFPQSDLATQLAFQKMIDRDLDGVDVSSRCVFIVAGNRVKDNAGAEEIPQHLRNRFSWINIDVSVQAWVDWAKESEILDDVIQFIRFKPSNLNTFNPDSEELSYATPRSVTEAARVMKKSPIHLWRAIAHSTCGETWAGDFISYLEMKGTLPDPQEVLDDPAGFDIPTSWGVLFALSTAVADYAAENPAKYRIACAKFIERIHDFTPHGEIAASCLRTLATGDKAVLSDPECRFIFTKMSDLLAA